MLRQRITSDCIILYFVNRSSSHFSITMPPISSYRVHVSDSQIADLKTRLSMARFPDELESAGWDLGSPLSDIKNLVDYWRDRFDWRKVEATLNRLPQYKTEIDVEGFGSLDIHFIHQKSQCVNAIPLIFIHGWPGSFIEVTKIIDGLVQGGDSHPSFHVVAPSLPNHGFSSGVKQRGFAFAQYAEVCHKIMLRLGYNQYVTQGGDNGYYTSRAMSLLYPGHCMATHLNFEYAEPPSFFSEPLLALRNLVTPYTAREVIGLQRTAWFSNLGSGYQNEQSTKPQTIGYALSDSPVALLSWIYEKLHDWTDAYPWTEEEVCTWICIYWFSTAGPAASIRIYHEVKNDRFLTSQRLGSWISHVKIGFSRGPMELRSYPSTWRKNHGHVVFERDHEHGGHFLAWESPTELLADVRRMFGKNGGAFGVVPGHTGFTG